MAYTIISQNNTTTTLSDENGNVITVPARVTLATSTDYTIKKVNNNSVDLESGDGKIIRGVPACVVLAGESGGGGGSSLPDQTGQSGKFLTTDGTDASWSDKPLVNTATGAASLSVLGSVATASSATNLGSNTAAGNGSTVVGSDINAATSSQSVVVGYDIGQGVGTPNGSIHLGASIKIRNGLKVVALGTNIDTGNNNSSNLENIDENGIYWGTGWNSLLNKWGVYKLMSADGTIPAARHASLPAADGTYVLKLVISSGVPTLSWVAE